MVVAALIVVSVCQRAAAEIASVWASGHNGARVANPGRPFMSKSLLISLFMTLLFVLQAQAEDKSFPGIEEIMSSEQFSEAGLDRLSAEELKALNAWLVRYTAGEADIMRQHNEEVRQASKDVDIRSRIKGDFNGWSGETIFRLENGQVWRQRLSGRYSYKGPPNPEISIGRNFMGFYMMTVVETGKKVGVKLVR